MDLGALLGPFSAPPFHPWFQTSPLLTAPKDDGARRVVLDLSFPQNFSINSGVIKNCIDGTQRNYTLPSIKDLVEQVKLWGKGSYIYKADLQRAYRQLRNDPIDTTLLGFSFEGKAYLDLCPPFGARLSGNACQRTTSALTFLMRSKGHWMLNYLDDFCGGHQSLSGATEAYDHLLGLTKDLGLALAPKNAPLPPLS